MTRKYSDREVGLILQRALEPAAGESDLDWAGEGLSLEQIQEIAAEVGIDPARVEVAAASLLEPEAAPPNPYVGIPTTLQLQTTLEDRVLDPARLSEVLTLIRGVQHRQGITGSEFGSLEWRAKDALGARYVSVIPTEEGIRVRVLGNFRDGLFVTAALAGSLGLAAGGLLVDGLALGAWSFPILAAAAAVPPRFVYRWLRRKEDSRLREVFHRLVAFLGASRGLPEGAPEGEGGVTPPDAP
ncbi:MAG: hypothetical protein P8170_08210 [Gemmatimonadota bacterium]